MIYTLTKTSLSRASYDVSIVKVFQNVTNFVKLRAEV
jgi:hypothetical protein